MTKKASCKIASVKTYEDKEGGRKSVGRISEHRGGIAGTYGVQNMQNVPDFISACVSANISEIKSVLTKGLPIKYYDYLIDQMRMPSGDLAAVLDISSKTLYNRKHAGAVAV